MIPNQQILVIWKIELGRKYLTVKFIICALFASAIRIAEFSISPKLNLTWTMKHIQ